MRQICEFRSNYESISRDCLAMVARLSHDSRATFVRVSHDFPANVAYFHFNSYNSRTTFFRQIVARFSHVFSRLSRDRRATVVRHSHDICTSVAKISQRQLRDTRTNVARPSHNTRATVLQNIVSRKFA